MSVLGLPPGLYAATRTRAARVALLREAAAKAPRVVLHVRVASVGTHRGRLLRDPPRHFLRALGEPGDRIVDGAFVHCFFDDEELLGEIAAAGLSVVERHNATWTLEIGAVVAEATEAFLVELARTLRVARACEKARTRMTPEEAVRNAQQLGKLARSRGPLGRARLRRAISWVDAAMGENCYRRVLLEVALDGGAACEKVVFSLDVGKKGHVALDGRDETTAAFDIAFAITPDDRDPD